MQSNPQVPWTEEQWVRVNLAIQEEAQRARVAAKLSISPKKVRRVLRNVGLVK